MCALGVFPITLDILFWNLIIFLVFKVEFHGVSYAQVYGACSPYFSYRFRNIFRKVVPKKVDRFIHQQEIYFLYGDLKVGRYPLFSLPHTIKSYFVQPNFSFFVLLFSFTFTSVTLGTCHYNYI